MKVINYKRGYLPEFDCSIHGRITVQGKPELAIIEHLLNTMPIDSSYPWIKPLAIERFNKAKNNRFCLGVSATEYIVNTLGLRNYKKGNYMFTIQ